MCRLRRLRSWDGCATMHVRAIADASYTPQLKRDDCFGKHCRGMSRGQAACPLLALTTPHGLRPQQAHLVHVQTDVAHAAELAKLKAKVEETSEAAQQGEAKARELQEAVDELESQGLQLQRELHAARGFQEEAVQLEADNDRWDMSAEVELQEGQVKALQPLPGAWMCLDVAVGMACTG